MNETTLKTKRLKRYYGTSATSGRNPEISVADFHSVSGSNSRKQPGHRNRRETFDLKPYKHAGLSRPDAAASVHRPRRSTTNGPIYTTQTPIASVANGTRTLGSPSVQHRESTDRSDSDEDPTLSGGISPNELRSKVPALRTHRFLLSLCKYPGIACIVLASYVLWGPIKEETDLQRALGIISMILGCFAFIVWIYGQLNHHNKLRIAQRHTAGTVVQLVGSTVLSFIQIVVSGLTIAELRTSWNGNGQSAVTEAATAITTELPIFDDSNLEAMLGVLVGAGLLVFFTSLAAMVFAVVALSQMHRLSVALQMQTEGFVNPAMLF